MCEVREFWSSQRIIRIAVGLLSLATLIGCQGESVQKQAQQAPSSTLQLQSALINVSSDEGFVDLTPYITLDSSVSSYELEVIASTGLEQNCLVNSVNDDGFYFHKTQDVCVYEYQVTTRNTNGIQTQKQNKARILSSLEDEISLTPISSVIDVGQKLQISIALDPGYEFVDFVAFDGDIQADFLGGNVIEIDASNVNKSGMAIM
jgi:hypothetical protein